MSEIATHQPTEKEIYREGDGTWFDASDLFGRAVIEGNPQAVANLEELGPNLTHFVCKIDAEGRFRMIVMNGSEPLFPH